MQHCYLKLRDRLSSFSRGERKVAEYIIENAEAIPKMPIVVLAQNCGTSKATVVRLCKSLGLAGYKELCMNLNAELLAGNFSNYTYNDVMPGQQLRVIAESVAENNIKSIRNTLSIVDYGMLRKAVDVLAKAQRIDFYGVGCSSLIAMDAQNKFMRIGKFTFSSTDVHMQLIASTSLTDRDAAVFISNSGETKDVIAIMQSVKNTGAVTISITGFGNNTLSKLSDIKLYTSSDEGIIRIGAMSSRIGILSVIDMLYSAITSENYASVKQSLDKTTEIIKQKKN